MKKLVILLTFLLMLPACKVSAAVRNTDVSAPSSGNVIVTVPGSFEKANITNVLKLVNGYRYEACTKGYPDPRDSRKSLTSADYVPIKWSGDMEWLAQTRAAEGCVYQSHTRPNGDSCFSCIHNGYTSEGECLAWNNSGLISGIKQWYEEKDDWIGKTGYQTGHYEALINPDYRALGIGCFTSKSGSWICVAGEFSSDDTLAAASQGVSGACSQKMEVVSSHVGKPTISGNGTAIVNTTLSLTVQQSVTYPRIMGGSLSTPITAPVKSFSTSRASIAAISSNGVLKALKEGTTEIIAILDDGTQISKNLTVVPPSKGEVFKVGKVTYKVTKAKKELAYVKRAPARGNIVIPATATYAGRKYKITSIANNAFKGNKKIKSVKIGKNIRKIGKKAFYGCTALKKVTIQSKLLKASAVGSNAFAKTKISKVKCPAAKKKAYKKFLLKKGMKKKVKFY